jgi:thiol-activated cytolysin
MNKEVIDHIRGLKREDSDLAYDGKTKLVTRQTIDGNQCILISCDKKEISNSLDTMIVLSTIKSTIYPGSVILANSDLVNGTPTEVSLTKKDGKITIDSMHKSAQSKMDSSSVNATVDKLLLEYLADKKLKAQSDFSYSFKEAFSKEQIKASLGIDCDKIKLSCNFETIKSGESKAVIIAFNQVYFTASCDRPVNSDVFDESITLEDIKGAGIGNNNVPCYISSVSYGRSFYICMQTSKTSLDMTIVAEATIKNIKTKTDDELHQDLKECSISCVCIGGDPDSHIKIISGNLDEISQVINENIELSSTNYGYPISYCCNYLCDNKVAIIKCATEYVKITREITYGHALHLSSNCGYVYHWNIYWTVRNVDNNGEISESVPLRYSENGINHSSGWADTIQIPANASKISVRCDNYWWFHLTRNVCNENVLLKNNIYTHLTGTSLNPKCRISYRD